MVATGVQLKRTKSRKTLFSSSGTDKYVMFLLVIATGSSLLHCSMDDFSKVNETRIKVLSSHPSGHVEVRCPRGKKSISSVIKNIVLMLLRKRFLNK